VTKQVTEVEEQERRGVMRRVVCIVAFPKVVMRESEVLHANAIEPALQLLQNQMFKHANTEFLAALEDYRKNDFGDSLVKCGSAMESVMKVLCHKKGWTYKETDVASTLVKTVLANTRLESYFESLLMIVATLRNRLSPAHGAGTKAKSVDPHLARFAINVTASVIILLVDEAGI
jgi:hypothetical protein